MAKHPASNISIDPTVASIDLSAVRRHLTSSSAATFSQEQWEAAELEYRQYLTIRRQFPGRFLMPTGVARTVWQAHIVDTRAYRSDCTRIFGRYLDHFPYLALLSDQGLQEQQEAESNYTALLRRQHQTSVQPCSSSPASLAGSDDLGGLELRTPPKVVLVALPWAREGQQLAPLGHASISARLRTDPAICLEEIVRPVSDQSFPSATVAAEIMACFAAGDTNSTVAIGAYVWNDEQVKELVGHLRSLGFSGRIILGGPQISYATGGLEQLYPGVDCFVRGAGESALYALVSGRDPAAIAGVHVAGASDKGIQARADLDSLPSPYLTGLLDPAASGSIHWETQRGCQFRCSFCQHRQPGKESAVIKVDRARVYAEIDLFCAAKTPRISVLDPIFNRDKQWATDILDRFAERGFSGELSLQCRPEMIDPSFLDAAAKLDVTLEFGLQSVVDAESRAVNRPNHLGKVEEILSEVQKRGIRHEVSLIYGLPRQTLTTFRQSIDWCLKRNVQTLRAFPLLLLRGTPLADQRLKWGMEVKPGPIPLVTASASFSADEWRQMDALAHALSVTEGAHPGSVEELLATLAQNGRGSIPAEIRALEKSL